MVLELVSNWPQDKGLETLLLNSQANFACLTGGGEYYVYIVDAGGVAYLLVTPHHAYLPTNNIEARRLQDEVVAGLPFEAVTWPWHQPGQAKEKVSCLGNPTKAVSDLGSLGLPPVSHRFNELRYTLLPSEIERYRCLGKEAAQAVESARLSAIPGNTELDVAAALADQCQRHKTSCRW